MSRLARVLVALIAIAVVPLEVIAYLAYRNTVDGEVAVVGPVIVVYALLAIGGVWIVDRAVRSAAAARRSFPAGPATSSARMPTRSPDTRTSSPPLLRRRSP